MNTFYGGLSGIYLLNSNISIDLVLAVWVMWIIPILWPLICILYSLFYSVVLYLSMIYLKIENRKKVFLKSIKKMILFGFLCDTMIAGVLFLLELGKDFINPNSDFYHWYKSLTTSLNGKPLANIFAILTLSFLILLSRILNYKLNKRYTFSKLDIEEENKKKLALAIAIFTAPYMFFFTITI
ncbi:MULTISPECIES: hypothetical protein [unclassified Parvimonas]|uniref:hypothetical protein n=1 Tax=unclassified Parvimonas TaxID=1151464 RepID=UPI002B4828C8|nr:MULTISPECIES: hypothetical protein [unclassified Parvimonas]MEB3025783.1 hypothetical protein [Parvimonas sp. M13]MEB3089929.1 hypothetical protein [Parvimonas sp. M20]